MPEHTECYRKRSAGWLPGPEQRQRRLRLQSQKQEWFFSCCVFLFELTQVFDGYKPRFLQAKSAIADIAGTPIVLLLDLSGADFSSFYGAGVLSSVNSQAVT